MLRHTQLPLARLSRHPVASPAIRGGTKATGPQVRESDRSSAPTDRGRRLADDREGDEVWVSDSGFGD